MKQKINHFLLLLTALTLGGCANVPFVGSASSGPKPVSLAGEWRFAMDRDDTGMDGKWYEKNLSDRIKLPGILQSQGYGDEISVDTKWIAALPRDMRWYLKPEYEPYTHPGNIKVPYLSQPDRHYIGLAWYQRDIDVAPDWQGKRVHLFLERPRWETTVWVDDKQIGNNNSLCAPHEYDLGMLTAGQHRLTIRCDTRMTVVSVTRPDGTIAPGYRLDGHSVSDALGYSWNGIAGKIELSASSPTFIDDVQVYPNVEKKSAVVKVTIGSLTGLAGAGKISVGDVSADVKWAEKGGEAELEVPLANAKLWDEFHPELQHLTVRFNGGQNSDSKTVTFGMREIKANGTKLLLNGHELDIRSTHSGGDFPLTGYPATDVPAWKKIFQLCKNFGLNGMRFHSWCPPDEAFTAADELGFYLAPECGMWNAFNPGDPVAVMLEKETVRIKKAYGNHPSFVMLSASNETSGNWQPVLNPWAANWYKDDPRRLYCTNTGRSVPASPGAQYASIPARGYQGWFGKDYSNSPQLRNAIMPVLAHEVGQWCAYPDFDVINKFTGYLKGKNYEIYRDSAIAHGALEQNKEFAFASGKFQLQCYKEEIEANLRTSNLSGFQILDLHDYIGQGGALVGVCDPFWTPKSYVTAELFHRFSGPIVPLARMTTPVMRASDPFSVNVEIAQFGDGPLTAARPYWKIVDLNGKTAAQGEWGARDIPIGKGIPLGKIDLDLTKIPSPMQYKLVVGLTGMKVENDWNFWVYPTEFNTAAPADVLVTSDWSQASAKLTEGGKVLFVPLPANLDNMSPPLNNVPFFWNRLMNPNARGEAMLGLLVQDKHPALAEFPTQGWCDWDWNELVRNVRAVNVEKAPKALRPIVQPVDDWSRNYKLGVVFECKVGSGRLMVSSVELSNDLERRISARQLRQSLLSYMSKDSSFQPTVTLTMAEAAGLFPGASATPLPAVTPQALPGDIQEGPNTPRRGGQ